MRFTGMRTRVLGNWLFPYWNVAEAAVVFDKYERRLELNARKLLRNLLRESSTLSRLQRLVVVSVNPSILRASLKLVMKHHIYVADALQLASAKNIDNCIFVWRQGTGKSG